MPLYTAHTPTSECSCTRMTYISCNAWVRNGFELHSVNMLDLCCLVTCFCTAHSPCTRRRWCRPPLSHRRWRSRPARSRLDSEAVKLRCPFSDKQANEEAICEAQLLRFSSSAFCISRSTSSHLDAHRIRWSSLCLYVAGLHCTRYFCPLAQTYTLACSGIQMA